MNTGPNPLHLGLAGHHRLARGWPWITIVLSVASACDFDYFEKQILTRDGADRIPELDKLKKLDHFIDSQIEFGDDMSIFNYSDDWTTPLETIGHGCGDCEDFAIINYFRSRRPVTR